MRAITSQAFNIVNSLSEETINNLRTPNNIHVYRTPYKEVPLQAINVDTDKLTMFNAEDIAFVNTSGFTETGRNFIKTGKYTNAHPKFDKREYNAFWDREEDRCKNGMSLPGKLMKREDGTLCLQKVHITGEHYGYLNFAEIKRSKEFEVKKGALYGPGSELLNSTHNGGHTKSFSLPSFWDGDYYFFKAIELCRQIGKHLVVGKARRKGYSYKNGWLVANLANFIRRSTSVVGAYDAASLFDDGTMVKVMNYLNFINKHTDWSKGRLANTLEHIEIGFRYKGDEAKYGFLSNIYTAVLKTNPGGMRGKDADLLLLEEAGKCPNLSAVLDATLKTLTDGAFITGLMIIFGTGGGEDNLWQGFEDLFYECYARNFVMFNNVWDDEMEGTGCGFFHASYMNKPGLIDKHGNSDIAGSLAFDDFEKSLLKNSPAKLNAHEMEEPRKPSEAFSRSVNNIFPAKEINEQLRRCLHEPSLQGIGRQGFFLQKEGNKIAFIDNNNANAYEKQFIYPELNNYPLRQEDNDLRGCWVLVEQPYRDANGNIPENLYHIWNDPFGISKEKGEFKINKDSLASCFLYEAANNLTPTKGDRIIGWYHGRTEETKDYDEQMFLAALYFNAKILFENDRGDVFNNAKNRGLLHILKEETEFQFQKELTGGGKGRKKGISIAANMNRKATGVIYLKDWLLSKRGTDKNGNQLLNLHYIYDIGLLRELLKFTNKGNFDRVSCAIVGMFDIKETLFKNIVPTNTAVDEEEDEYFRNPLNS
jgi:hypothetical protein